MNGYVKFALAISVIYVIYNVLMIALDLRNEKKKAKPDEHVVDVSDMVGDDEAQNVSEESQPLDEVLEEADEEQVDGLRIYTPKSVPDKEDGADTETKEEELMKGQEEISPIFGFQANPTEFEQYLKEKHNHSHQNQTQNVIDHL
jgi:hypothetical protein